MAAQRKYPDELRERAVKMVFEIRDRDGKGHGELVRVGRQLGVHPEALRSWLSRRKLMAASGPVSRPGISSGAGAGSAGAPPC
jgi:transposase